MDLYNSQLARQISSGLQAATMSLAAFQVQPSRVALLQLKAKSLMLRQIKDDFNQQVSTSTSDPALQVIVNDLKFQLDLSIAEVDSVVQVAQTAQNQLPPAQNRHTTGSVPLPWLSSIPRVVSNASNASASTVPATPASTIAAHFQPGNQFQSSTPAATNQGPAISTNSGTFPAQAQQSPPTMDPVLKELASVNAVSLHEKTLEGYSKSILDFEGGVIEYVGWRAGIDPYVKGEKDQHRMFQTLKKHLKKDALKHIGHIIAGTGDEGNRLIATLDEVYAHPQQIVSAFHNKLKKLPAMQETATSIRAFTNEMELVVAALSQYGKNPLSESLYMDTLHSKTPTKIWDKWALECQLLDKELFNPDQFLKFLKKLARTLETHVGCSNASSSSTASTDQTKNQNSKGWNKGKFNNYGWGYKPTERANVGNEKPRKVMHCHYCETDNDHWTTQCSQLRALSLEDRTAWVREKKLHKRCLDIHPPGEQCHIPKEQQGCPERLQRLSSFHYLPEND